MQATTIQTDNSTRPSPVISPVSPTMPAPRWEHTLRSIVLVIARLALAYLFFTQLWWKLPPRFGCPADFVLKQFSSAEKKGLVDFVTRGSEAVESLITKGLERTQQDFNN